MKQISRRNYIKNQLATLAGLSLMSFYRFPADILDFQLGVWGTEQDFITLEKLNLADVTFKKLEKPGKAGLFTNGVLIAGKIDKRAKLAMQYLEKHPVLMTLPLADNLEDFEALHQLSIENANVLGVISPLHFLPMLDRAKSIMQENDFGKINFIRMNVTSGNPDPFLKALSSGELGWHFHLISLVCSLMRKFPDSLHITETNASKYSRIDLEMGQIDSASLNVTDNIKSGEYWNLEINGDKGMLRLKGNHSMMYKDSSGTSQIFNFSKEGYQIAFMQLINDFVDSVKEDKAAEVGIDTGLLNWVMDKAVLKSLKEGKKIPFRKTEEDAYDWKNMDWLIDN